MFQEVAQGVYSAQLPIPVASLHSVNVYVIKGERVLLIDTGMNSKECLDHLLRALDLLDVKGHVDLFVTHFHVDHFGNVRSLSRKGARVYISKEDWNSVISLKTGILRRDILRFLERSGFPAEEASSLFSREIDSAYEVEDKSVLFVRDGDIIACGSLELLCVATPGHTSGHMTLLDVQSGLYFSGDHLLYEISPTIQARSDSENPLKDYLLSLAKISSLPIEQVLPAHGRPFKDVARRVRDLIEHHEQRLEEILGILSRRGMTTYEIASLMRWDISYSDWAALPLAQRLFATGEAFAHLRYLEEEGLVRCERNGVYRWEKA